MGMKNLPIDTRCKRIITRGGEHLQTWLAQRCPEDERLRLSEIVGRIQDAGGRDLWVGDTFDDDGIERLDSLIVTLPPTDDRVTKLTAAIRIVETELGIEDPAADIGVVFAHVRVRV